MEIIPAVDMLGGRCVQLIGGDPDTKKDYGEPSEMALNWKNKGAKYLHVVDLDAALGLGRNLDHLMKIKQKTQMPVHFGGGIRDIDRIRELLRLDIDRIIIGTLSVKDYANDFEILDTAKQEYGEDKVIIAVDSRQGNVTVNGWQQKTDIKTTQLVSASEDYAWGFLYTDVSVEGKMQGINLEEITDVVSSTDKPVIVSGGITTKEDVSAISDTGAWGVVIGKALYEGLLDFKELV